MYLLCVCEYGALKESYPVTPIHVEGYKWTATQACPNVHCDRYCVYDDSYKYTHAAFAHILLVRTGLLYVHCLSNGIIYPHNTTHSLLFANTVCMITHTSKHTQHRHTLLFLRFTGTHQRNTRQPPTPPAGRGCLE